MNKPIVAIVGRPNVGKSTLFNRLAGARISIVDDKPGVTRDRIYADANWLNYDYALIDTGGLEPESENEIMKMMFRQTELAIHTADVVVFITDVRSGPLDSDKEVANLLRKAKKKVVLVVNKVDDMRKENYDIYEFYSLGLGEPIPISAGQALGIGDMLDEIVKHFEPQGESDDGEDLTIKVAITGKPNAGKSSLINKILGQERLIVSDTPGTTRDAVDTPFEKDGRKYILIDTAGMRRKSKIKENIERYSIVRALAAIERADVCVLMIDATEGVTEQDSKIAGVAHERGKAAVIAVNKWDLIEKDDKTMNKFLIEIGNELAFMPYAQKVFISALTGQRVNKLFDQINAAASNHCLRITTGMLNDVLAEATARNQPPIDKGKALRIYYMTQASVKPPTFVLFVNDTNLMHFSYKRYLENRIREAFGFSGTPIRFVIRTKGRD